MFFSPNINKPAFLSKKRRLPSVHFLILSISRFFRNIPHLYIYLIFIFSGKQKTAAPRGWRSDGHFTL